MLQNVNDSNFEELVLKSDKTVLVDFYADWCGPCKMIAPFINEIAEENEDLLVCKLDVDQAQQVAMKYGVSSIPTIISFKNGEIYKKNVGATTKDKLLDLTK